MEQMLHYGRFLAINDYAVLLIDAPGHGRSTSFPKPTPQNIVNVTENPLGGYLAHAIITSLRGLEVLRNQKFVNKVNLGICGFSMGGIISFIAGRLDWNVKAIVPIVASGNFPLAIVCGGLANIMIPIESRLSSKEIINLCKYFDVLPYAREITRGILILAGTSDEYLPLEAINETFNIIPSKHKFISIAPNWGHYLKHDEWEKLVLKFFNTYLKKEGVLSEPKISMEKMNFQITTAYYISITQQQRGKIYFRPAILGFPWIEAYKVAVIFSIVPSGIEYYAAGTSDDILEITTPIRIIGRNAYLAPLTLILSIGLLLLKTEERRELAIKISYWLYLLISMFLPVVTVWDRFTLTIPHVIERYGVLLGIIHSAWILILIDTITTLIFSFKGKFITASITQIAISLIAFIIAISVVRLKEIAIPNIGFILPIVGIIVVVIQRRRRKIEAEAELIKVLPPVKEEEL